MVAAPSGCDVPRITEVEKGELSQVPIEPMTEQYAPLGLGKLLEEKFIRFRRTKIGEQCFPPYITEHGG
jgi:hypothetical protein